MIDENKVTAGHSRAFRWTPR